MQSLRLVSIRRTVCLGKGEHTPNTTTLIVYQAPSERPLRPDEMADYHTTQLKTWIGGARGRAEDWEEPKNWYPYGVPDCTDKVVIGGYGRHRCAVHGEVDAVSGVSILPGAKLVISPEGTLSIDGELADPLGFLGDSGLHIRGILQVMGTLELRNAALTGIRNDGLLINEGRIRADATISTDDAHWGRFADRGDRVFLLPQ